MGSNTVPEHMNDPKSENWTKYGNVYDISNENSILKHGSAYGKRFIGPNMDTDDKDGYVYDSTGRYAFVTLIYKFKEPKIMPYPAFTTEIEALNMVIRRNRIGNPKFYTLTVPSYEFMHLSAAKKSNPEKLDRYPGMNPGPDYGEVDLDDNTRPKSGQDLNDHIGPNKVLDKM